MSGSLYIKCTTDPHAWTLLSVTNTNYNVCWLPLLVFHHCISSSRFPISCEFWLVSCSSSNLASWLVQVVLSWLSWSRLQIEVFNHDLTNSCIMIMIIILSSPHHQFRGRNSDCRPTLVDMIKWNPYDYHDFDYDMINSNNHGHDLIISSSRAARTADLPLTCWSGILGIANSGSPTFLRQCY